jgi:hypothetical protein
VKRATRVLVALVGAWLLFLQIMGAVYGRKAGDRVAARITDSLQAEATITTASLALTRGHLEINGLHARRDNLGVLDLKVGRIHCDLLPLGIGLFDRDCRELVIDDMRLEVSSAGLLRIQRPKREPMHVDAARLHNATFVLEASALAPDLGKIEIKIDEVAAGPTTFTTPLSWVFSMTALRATLALPAGVNVTLVYANGEVTATGSVLGSAPITVPLRLPRQGDVADAKAELAALAGIGRQLAEQLIERRAKDWLKTKIPSL